MSTAIDTEEDQSRVDLACEAREHTRQLHTDPRQVHGNPKDVNAGNKNAREVLAKLGGPDEPVAEGRLDMQSGERFYLGKRGIMSADREVLIVNWQLPIVAPFYKATVQDQHGAAAKRTFECDKNKIRSIEETIFADLAKAVSELEDQTAADAPQLDDTLLRELDATRDGQLRDIIKTIHAAQYELIELPLDRLVVIQGGPGTGKSVVALHRASYLIFNNESLTPSDVLVVGPNKTFTSYIQRLLPDLGDHGAEHVDLRGLGPIRSDDRVESDDVARLKGDIRMAGVLRDALHQRVGLSGAAKELIVRQPRVSVTISRQDIENQIGVLRGRGPHNQQREVFKQWLSATVSARMNNAEPDAPEIEKGVERIWPRLTAPVFVQELLGSQERLLRAAGERLTAADVTRLHRQAEKKISDETWSAADVALIDEADRLLNGPRARYAHIVVDEAQDLSPMQMLSIRNRSLTGSMTIVGDLAQSTGLWARDSWDEVASALQKDAEASFHELRYGYRVPRQVFEFAAQLMPHIAPQINPPKVIREGEEPDLVKVTEEEVADCAVDHAQKLAGMGRSVGLICGPAVRADVEIVLRHRGVKFTDVSDGKLGTTINLVSADQSKGLEFDAVVVADPAEIANSSDSGLRHLFISLTRVTQHLTVVYSGAVPELGLGGVMPTPESPTVVPRDDDRTGALPEEASTAQPEPSGASAVPAALDLVGLMAAQLAAQIRQNVAPGAYADLVRHLAEALGVAGDDSAD